MVFEGVGCPSGCVAGFRFRGLGEGVRGSKVCSWAGCVVGMAVLFMRCDGYGGMDCSPTCWNFIGHGGCPIFGGVISPQAMGYVEVFVRLGFVPRFRAGAAWVT